MKTGPPALMPAWAPALTTAWAPNEEFYLDLRGGEGEEGLIITRQGWFFVEKVMVTSKNP